MAGVFDYSVYNYGVTDQPSAALLQTPNLFTSVDGSVKSAAGANSTAAAPVQAGTVAWANAGNKLTRTLTFDGDGLKTSNILYLYFAPSPAAAGQSSVSATFSLKTAAKAPISIRSINYSTPDWSITVSPDTNAPGSSNVYISCKPTQLFTVQLSTDDSLSISAITLSSDSTLLLQAVAAQPQSQTSLKYPTKYNRGVLSRDVHDAAVDIGTFQPPQKLLRANLRAGSAGKFVVTAFGVKARSDAVIKPGNELFYASADTSVSSTELATGVKTLPPLVTLTENTNQSLWSGAGILGSQNFYFTKNEGMAAQQLALFFAPLIKLAKDTPDGKPALVHRETAVQIFNKKTRIPFSIPQQNSLQNVNGWKVALNEDGALVISYAGSAPDTMQFLPYVQLEYVGDSLNPLAPPITHIRSSQFPIQAVAGSKTAIAVATDVQSSCWDFQKVKASRMPLYRDVYSNSFFFGDAAWFTLSNVGLSTATASLQKYPINTLQTTPVGPFSVEQRVAAKSTWYSVPQNELTGSFLPTRYMFVEYVPKANEYTAYSPVPTSVILLYAENVPTNGGAVTSGYVTCNTSIGVSKFAPTANDFAKPLVTLAEAVALQVRWGVVVSVSLTGALIGLPRAAEERVFGLMYSDLKLVRLSDEGATLTVAVSKDGAVFAEPTPPVSGFQGSYLAHGVWMPTPVGSTIADNSPLPVEYDPLTMQVERQDRYSVIDGTGFTATNANMQWMIGEPTLTTAESLANANAIIVAATQTTADAKAVADLAKVAYGNVKDDVSQQLAAYLSIAAAQVQTQAAIATNSINPIEVVTAQAEAERVLAEAKAIAATGKVPLLQAKASKRGGTRLQITKPSTQVQTDKTPTLWHFTKSQLADVPTTIAPSPGTVERKKASSSTAIALGVTFGVIGVACIVAAVVYYLKRHRRR